MILRGKIPSQEETATMLPDDGPRYDPSDRWDIPDDREPDREPEDDLDPLTGRLTWDFDFIEGGKTIDRP